jgi:hypothetical protein
MTSLLDILKEADLRIGFTGGFTTAAAREVTDRAEVRRRLLLCLYGLGTNAGHSSSAGIRAWQTTLHPAIRSTLRPENTPNIVMLSVPSARSVIGCSMSPARCFATAPI